ncbi:MAG: rod shape-determining protein RodA [Candidatus Kapabacteria bacterium]|nr:rod shape-determining protein RodA [Ignavibacteriota bacterium]MCW5885829.1 rod shape-determining protein RodA [Candidatus Kapabacteria bacterium]
MKAGGFSLESQTVSFIDWKIIVYTLILLLAGMFSLYSATYGSNMQESFNRQVISMGIGILGALVLVFLPKNLMRNLAVVFYGISLIMLVAVLFIGDEVYGTKGWIRFAGFSLQPAEFAKFGVIVMLAYFLSSKGTDISNIRDFSISSLIVLVPIVLIFLQPDHGTSSVLLAIFFGILFWSGFSKLFLYFIVSLPFIVILSLKGFWFMSGSVLFFSVIAVFFRNNWISKGLVIGVFIVFGYIAPVLYNGLLDHQKSRVESFLNPGSDPRGQGYNVIQSMMAVGSGGLTGKGFLQGTQTQLRYIPMQWTDFIFSVPNEEFGFIGGFVILLFFGLLVLRILNAANESDDKFYSIAIFGIASTFLYHIIINVGMVIGLVPVMGIPLPFLSYGGTSMIMNLAFIGFILNAYRNHKRKRLV